MKECVISDGKRYEFPDGENEKKIERERIEAEMAEREAMLKKAEVLAWAYQRQAERDKSDFEATSKSKIISYRAAGTA